MNMKPIDITYLKEQKENPVVNLWSSYELTCDLRKNQCHKFIELSCKYEEVKVQTETNI